jgi:hypothetical protein
LTEVRVDSLDFFLPLENLNSIWHDCIRVCKHHFRYNLDLFLILGNAGKLSVALRMGAKAWKSYLMWKTKQQTVEIDLVPIPSNHARIFVYYFGILLNILR